MYIFETIHANVKLKFYTALSMRRDGDTCPYDLYVVYQTHLVCTCTCPVHERSSQHSRSVLLVDGDAWHHVDRDSLCSVWRL